jgi:hypothetical protein
MLGIANIGGTPGYTLLELRRSLRDRRFLALVIGWPVGAYLLFSSVFGSNEIPQPKWTRCLCSDGSVSQR